MDWSRQQIKKIIKKKMKTHMQDVCGTQDGIDNLETNLFLKMV